MTISLTVRPGGENFSTLEDTNLKKSEVLCGALGRSTVVFNIKAREIGYFAKLMPGKWVNISFLSSAWLRISTGVSEPCMYVAMR